MGKEQLYRIEIALRPFLKNSPETMWTVLEIIKGGYYKKRHKMYQALIDAYAKDIPIFKTKKFCTILKLVTNLLIYTEKDADVCEYIEGVCCFFEEAIEERERLIHLKEQLSGTGIDMSIG